MGLAFKMHLKSGKNLRDIGFWEDLDVHVE
jgi:hypothetical protein